MSDAPIAPEIRDQAIAWFTLAQSGCLGEAERLQLESWRRADGEHERAWQRLAGIPQGLRARAEMLRDPAARRAAEQTRPMDRRQALKVLVGAGLLGAVAWQGYDSRLLQGALADLSTATGERRHQRLADGSELWLNTASAVDVRFDATQRLLRLCHGELELLTGHDPASRPLVVLTAEARLRPLGTRFSVRRDDGERGTLLGVSQGRVAVEPLDGSPGRIVEAGWQTRIDASGVAPAWQADGRDTAWVDGFIVAERMRLGDFVAELARHRPGVLRCDPACADLRLTGSFPLDDGERILALLESSLPVRVARVTPYWVTLLPR